MLRVAWNTHIHIKKNEKYKPPVVKYSAGIYGVGSFFFFFGIEKYKMDTKIKKNETNTLRYTHTHISERIFFS